MSGQQFRGEERAVAALPGQKTLGVASSLGHFLGQVPGPHRGNRGHRPLLPDQAAKEDLARRHRGDEKQSGCERHADWFFDDTTLGGGLGAARTGSVQCLDRREGDRASSRLRTAPTR